jgi:hypothetical protein
MAVGVIGKRYLCQWEGKNERRKEKGKSRKKTLDFGTQSGFQWARLKLQLSIRTKSATGPGPGGCPSWRVAVVAVIVGDDCQGTTCRRHVQ